MTSLDRDQTFPSPRQMLTMITNGRVVTENETIEKGVVLVYNGEIVYVGPEREKPDWVDVEGSRLHTERDVQQFDAQGGYICPGMIDVHVHGGGGVDAMDGTTESLIKMARTHGAHGTTGFLATTLTERYDRIIQAAKAVRQLRDEQAQSTHVPTGGARVLGLHLEGPYIHPNKVGAQNPEFVRAIKLEELQHIADILGDAFRLITMAPELDGGMEAVRFLRERGVVLSIGHTDATFEEATKAFEAGMSHVTHMYNAMSPLHHRNPGVVGASLLNGDVMCEIIADGIHLHPAAIRIVYEQKGPDRICLITDGIAATGMPPGDYSLGGQPVKVEDGACLLSDGTLAGSILTMDRAVGFIVREVGVPVWEAVRMASLNPARQLGIADRKGSLAQGKDADITVLDENFQAVSTWVEGVRLV